MFNHNTAICMHSSTVAPKHPNNADRRRRYRRHRRPSRPNILLLLLLLKLLLKLLLMLLILVLVLLRLLVPLAPPPAPAPAPSHGTSYSLLRSVGVGIEWCAARTDTLEGGVEVHGLIGCFSSSKNSNSIIMD